MEQIVIMGWRTVGEIQDDRERTNAGKELSRSASQVLHAGIESDADTMRDIMMAAAFAQIFRNTH